MSVQPALALAEAVALSEMQMAAFEGGTLGTSINPGVYLPGKNRRAVQPLFVGCFIFIVLQGYVFLSAVLMPPDSADSSKNQDISG